MEDINGHRKLISQEWKNLPKGFCIYSTHDGGNIQRVISDHDEMQSIFERVLTAYKQETEPAVLVPKTPTVATATATPQYRRSSRRNRRRGGGDSPTEPLLSLPYKYGSGLDWDPIYMCWKPKLVTIACSSVDMFTPTSDAHWILNRVVKKIKSAYGNHIDLIFDDDVELSL